ncbi:MAG: B12 lower ligand biosynthesis ThiC-like protein BzaB [Desulfurispora sp.]|uniref:B12 lower ligand biosynthesis ThiC-like protein BzaB n=1 Tax=Desulfurispora sp. TaxID=3014275 RepID=UPI00404AE601
MTQLLKARAGEITPEMLAVAGAENIAPEVVRDRVARGTVVIPKNKNRRLEKVCGIGEGLRVKVNALIGTSSDRDDPALEERKIRAALRAGADAFMDLSTGGDIDGMRRLTLATAGVPVGSVPLYQAAVMAIEQRGSVVAMTAEDIFSVIEKQAAEGMDFMAIHSALNFDVLKRLQETGRINDIVSRGGAFMTGWMLHNQQENPLYEQFDRLLEILREYDVTLSVGDAIRPGCTADSLDAAQLQGLMVAGQLVARARAAGVQVMVEGPGHVPLHHVPATMLLQKRLCQQAPYYILGTLSTDIAPGYDHISAAIGAALAGQSGADFLCYVTPAEHLGLPTEDDVYTGVMAARLAAHAADLARGNRLAWQQSREMGQAARRGDWQRWADLALDPHRLAAALEQQRPEPCPVCGENCLCTTAAAFLAG